jgi:hypothetical protein
MSCGSRQVKSVCSGGNDKDKCCTLKEVVAHYEAHFKKDAEGIWDYFGGLGLEECIKRAPKGLIEREGKDICHPHQYRINKAAAEEFSKRLMRNKARLKKATAFDELFGIIEKFEKDFKGIGPLTIYDTAHRIGCRLGLKPEKVYLHAGTEKGTRALLKGRFKRATKFCNKDELPGELREFSAEHIENILCIYKNSLAFK